MDEGPEIYGSCTIPEYLNINVEEGDGPRGLEREVDGYTVDTNLSIFRGVQVVQVLFEK